ncbi:DUF2790 domain-containing protein [Pseudomonas asiatica]|uniref:DUF2790 domain-containing protein n=1 Tax=Pseudomonas asiatica TaxID=2219225 RepID=UPI003839E638
MKLKIVIASLLLAAQAQMTIANASEAQEQTVVEDYRYDMKLDIADVVNISPVPDGCGVYPVTMTYVDHSGDQHTIRYQVYGTACKDS